MKVLITGIHGFVGSNMVRSLQKDYTIYGLDIVSDHLEGVKKIYAWNDLFSITDIDIIIHLAGKAHDVKNISLAKEYFEINTELTKKIYDWFLESSAQKFIFFSTVKAVADVVNDGFLTEDVDAKPVGPYGMSKRDAELYILSKKINQSAKQTYILRPTMIHGKGNKGNLNLLYEFVRKGIPWPLGAYENKRSFTSIDNLIFIIQNLIDHDIEGGVYQIADDDAISTRDLIAIISETLNKPTRIWDINKSLINFLALVGSKLNLPFNQERVKKLTENYIVSNEKIKKAIGIQKMPVATVEGLTKSIKSFIK
ncbi:MAG: NAD-dependent epimerase/dehydratase family protein [Paludibacter sp.]|nr:NAD-dependent epimerase/dehydratase family protein [Paludibacter sp.]